MSDETVQCVRCGEDYPRERRSLGFLTCLECGEAEAKQMTHCVVPMHKSSLGVISPREPELLKGISNKGGQISGGGQNSGEPLVLDGRSVSPRLYRRMQVWARKIMEAPPHRSAIVRSRSIRVIEGGGQPTKLVRQPWYKRSEPNKK